MHLKLNQKVNSISHSLGCPEVIRQDPGTENTTTATLQMVFRRAGTDSRAWLDSQVYGKSIANQVRSKKLF